MLQCLQATVPLLRLYIHDPNHELAAYLEGKGQRLQKFLSDYHSGAKSSHYALDPSSVFDVICKQKHYFGNYSQQDSHDALLALTEAIIDAQKQIYKTKTGVATKLAAIPAPTVPLGKIFSFYLSSRCISVA